MSKKKTQTNTSLEILKKINVLNKRINKQRKSVINNLKSSLETIENPVLVNESTKLDKLERERIMLINKLKK
tara:strand:- start:3840 stop:4055 length:216 start_codon:yes stop_codon:yes gene_type:complete